MFLGKKKFVVVGGWCLNVNLVIGFGPNIGLAKTIRSLLEAGLGPYGGKVLCP